MEILSSPQYDEADRAYDATLADSDTCKIFLAERAPYELAHKCGGAWIGDGWVVTAAHCVDNIPGFDGNEGNVLTDRRIRLGTHNLTVGDGLYLTNYESVRDGRLDVNEFNAVSLDEASVLRSYGSGGGAHY